MADAVLAAYQAGEIALRLLKPKTEVREYILPLLWCGSAVKNLFYYYYYYVNIYIYTISLWELQSL